MTIEHWARRAEDQRAWARRAVWLVLLLGLVGLVVRGADRPADPVLAEAVPGSERRPLSGFDETAFRVRTPAGELLDWCALLAASDAARSQGLMGQTDLRGYDGMVFRFDAPGRPAFYMYRTLIPLTVAFFDEAGAFVNAADMEPCLADDASDCPTYPATAPVVLALEVPEGGLGALGIGEGSTLQLVEGGCT